MEATFTLHSSEVWGTTAFTTDARLTTPFEKIRSLSIHTEGGLEKAVEVSGKLKVDLNGEEKLGVSGKLSTKNKMEATVTFTQPRPMEFSITVSNKDIDLLLNFNLIVL